MNWNIFCQITIPLFSIIACWVNTVKNERIRRWTYIISMFNQPLWLVSTYMAGQWGMFVASIVFTYIQYRGIRNFWFSNLK